MKEITYVFADKALVERIRREWSQVAADHMEVENGFSLVAMDGSTPVGLIGVYWNKLPVPLEDTPEAYIDIIDVQSRYRKRGIARELVNKSIDLARKHGAYQLRAWSSMDKTEALPMWRRLGFALCPATIYPRGEEVRGFYVSFVL